MGEHKSRDAARRKRRRQPASGLRATHRRQPHWNHGCAARIRTRNHQQAPIEETDQGAEGTTATRKDAASPPRAALTTLPRHRTLCCSGSVPERGPHPGGIPTIVRCPSARGGEDSNILVVGSGRRGTTTPQEHVWLSGCVKGVRRLFSSRQAMAGAATRALGDEVSATVHDNRCSSGR